MNPSQELVTLTFVKDIKNVSIYLHYSKTVNIIYSAVQMQTQILFHTVKKT